MPFSKEKNHPPRPFYVPAIEGGAARLGDGFRRWHTAVPIVPRRWIIS